MIDLSKNIEALIQLTKSIQNDLIIKSVKDKSLKDTLKKSDDLKKVINDMLENLKGLEETNPNIFICYDNDIYLSVIGNKYITSHKTDNGVKILKQDDDLQKALKHFYHYAYKEKIK